MNASYFVLLDMKNSLTNNCDDAASLFFTYSQFLRHVVMWLARHDLKWGRFDQHWRPHLNPEGSYNNRNSALGVLWSWHLTPSARLRLLWDPCWGTPLGVPQYWFDQTWGKWAIIEGDNFFFINRVVALSGRIWSGLPDSNADGCF